jgi:type I restriction enzyme S subunit
MNPELLLAHFDRVSNGSDAIPRLRRFVLDLAVRGKLVEQDSNDEPVATLLKENDHARRTIADKDRRADAGRQKLLAAENRWDIPPSWNWCALADLVLFIDYRGKTPAKTENGVRLITAKNVKKGFINFSPEEFLSEPDYHAWMTRGLPKEGDILFTTEAPIGNAAVVRIPERFALAQRVICFCPYGAVNPDFLTLQLLSEPFQYVLNKTATGLTAKGIKAAKLARFPIALPPLAEQYRIVSRVQELMALCDRFEEAFDEQERLRNRLATASQHQLSNGSSVEDFRKHAHFYISHLRRITTHPGHIEQLRQTILSLAVRGLLVHQDSEDEPASELLKRVMAQKARLVKEGKIKEQKPLPPVEESTIPFSLPSGWSWTRLGNLSRLVTSGSRDWAKFYAADGAIFVRMGNLSRDSYQLRLTNIQRVKPPADSEGARTRLEEGDILISITGEVGLLGLIPHNFGEAYINQHTCLVRPTDLLRGRYLPELFRSPFAQSQFDEPQRGLKNSFRLTDVTEFLVPLPPLSEQSRIVAKIDELMAVCDRLEGQLATSRAETGLLLDAALYGALHDSCHEMENGLG